MPVDIPVLDRDRLMAARMAMPAEESLGRLGLTNWGQTLTRAGVIDGLQSGRGFQSQALDGHWCLSLFELAIDNFMTRHGISHEHEPSWPADPTLNRTGSKRADWLLSDGTYVEAAGMLDDPEYAAKMDAKQELAEAHGLRLLVITPADGARLPAVLQEWLPPTNLSSGLDPRGRDG
jgi:hypothetical protein